MTVEVSRTDMTCMEFVELVTDYIDHVLPEAELRRFDEHLEICPYCVTYVEQMRTTIQVLGRLDEAQIDPVAIEPLLHEFRNWKREPGEA